MPLGGSKDEHFSCFHMSCQTGLSSIVEGLHNTKSIVLLLMRIWHEDIWSYQVLIYSTLLILLGKLSDVNILRHITIRHDVLLWKTLIILPSITTGTCATSAVLQMLLRGLIELHVQSMSLGIVLCTVFIREFVMIFMDKRTRILLI